MIKVDRRSAHVAATELKRASDVVRVTLDGSDLLLQSDRLAKTDVSGDLQARLPRIGAGARRGKPLDIVVSSKALLGVLSPRRSGVVTFVREDDRLVVGIDAISAKLNQIGAVERHPDASMSERKVLVQHAPHVLDDLTWVARAIGEDVLRPHLMRVVIDYDKEGAGTVVATDGSRLHAALIEDSGIGPRSELVYLESSIVGVLTCCYVSSGKEDVFTVSRSPDKYRQVFNVGMWKVRSYADSPEFTNWRNVLACLGDKSAVSCEVDALVLSDVIKTLQNMSDAGKGVALLIGMREDEHLRLSLAGSDENIDGCELELPLKFTSELIELESGVVPEVSVNAAYLLDALPSCKSGAIVELAITEELEPLVVRQDSRTAYVMPLRR